MDNKLVYTVILCAVIFGSDETLLNVDLGEEFIFKRMSLKPLKDHLDLTFKTDAMGLRRDYETARIGENLDIICAFKSYTICLTEIEAEKYYKEMSDYVLTYLDDRIRAIRLFVEGPIHFKKLSIEMKSETLRSGETDMCSNINSVIPIGEAVGTSSISLFHCDNENINELNNNISSVKFPLSDVLLNNCHRYYDLSYHLDNFISITLLITSLEILFLNNENAKKEKLAKRCSIFLYDNRNDQVSCYKKLIIAYKKRSDFVHDGNCLQIINEDILFLRDCVRKSLIKYVNNNYRKSDVIKMLKTTIKNLDYWSDTRT
ncbi:hypothetical protein [Desulfosporosinus sp. SB140]|uniref:hypothetical protein n=1 Tax=Desulfosporosinus paludis TaxID=3115649 RepID=UPI00388E818F